MGIDIKKLVRISDSNQSLSRFSSDELITELIDRGHDAEYLYGDGISDSVDTIKDAFENNENPNIDCVYEGPDDPKFVVYVCDIDGNFIVEKGFDHRSSASRFFYSWRKKSKTRNHETDSWNDTDVYDIQMVNENGSVLREQLDAEFIRYLKREGKF